MCVVIMRRRRRRRMGGTTAKMIKRKERRRMGMLSELSLPGGVVKKKLSTCSLSPVSDTVHSSNSYSVPGSRP